MKEELKMGTVLEKKEDSQLDLTLYSPAARDILSKLSREQIEKLRNKHLYHATFREQAESILQNGLTPKAAFYSEDFEFISKMFDQYGVKNGWEEQSFRNFVMAEPLHRDAVFLSTEKEVVRDAYQIPERLFFLLQHANSLKDKSYISSEEKERCISILNKFREKFSSGRDDVFVFQVDMLSPPLLSYFADEHAHNVSASEFVEYMTDLFQDPDISFPLSIGKESLRVDEIVPLDIQKIEKRINEPCYSFREI